jgi:NADH dehydrogenase
MTEFRSETPHVLVVGGGYVATNACRALRKPIEHGQLRMTVVSRDNFQAFHGFIGEMVSGRVSPGSIVSPARRIFAPAQVQVAEIERIDLERRQVTAARHIDGARTVLSYDQLIVCLGTQERLDLYPGLAEHSFRLKAYADDFRLRNHVIEMYELADVETDPDERRRLLTFFIAGGGFAGTEVAGEMAHFATLLTSREYSGIRREECRVVLVEPGPTILPELYEAGHQSTKAHPRLGERAAAQLARLGVEVRTETAVAAVTPNEVTLSNGERIPTRTVISSVGMKPNPLVALLPFEKDEHGRIVTDRACRVPGWPGVWAGGDCAHVPNPLGGACPPVAVYALKQGTQIGRNIGYGLAGKRPRRFHFRGIGQGASIGRRYAVAELQGIEIFGLPAWIIWRVLLFYFFPSWDRRLRLLADWIIWPIVGRDIAQLRVDRKGDFEVVHNVFQAGETIAEERRTGHYIHIIVEGTVEKVVSVNGNEQVVATLGPGKSFGAQWTEHEALEEARAKTVVRTLSLRRDQAPQLQEVLRSASQIVAESGYFPAITGTDAT